MSVRLAFKNCAEGCRRNLPVVWHVLLYRAWISTLGIAALAVVLIFPDQSREILWGLGETIRSASQDSLEPKFRWNGVMAYAALWLGAVMLATALALVTRVMGAPVFLASARPRRARTDRVHDQRIVALCARSILVATLTVTHFTFLHQLTGSIVSTALMFVFLFVIIVLPWVALHRWRPNAGKKWHLATGILIFAVLAGLWFSSYHPFVDYDLMQILSAATPSLAIVAIVALGSRLPADDWTWAKVLVISTVLLSVAVFAPWSPNVIWTVGSVAVVLIWLAWAVCALACIMLVLRCLRSKVGVDLIALFLVAAWLLSMRHERFGREILDPVPSVEVTADQGLEAGEQANIDGKQDNTAANAGAHFAIHADGGGLRAALYTAEVLATADDISCGDFGAHVLAASGVSGGSLGIATWAVMRQEFIESEGITAWSECKELRSRYKLPADSIVEVPGSAEGPPTPLRLRVFGMLAQDHLSAVLATMLTSDFLWPWSDSKRGQALLDSWQTAAHDVLLVLNGSGWGQRPAFAMPLKDVNAGLNRPPLLMFTATDADSGNRIVFSNSKLASSSEFENLPIGVAALHSARFPLISPAGLVDVGKNSVRVVDGGYFDNSGAATLREVLIKAEAGNLLEGKATVVRIDGNAPDRDNPGCDTFLEQLASKGYYPAGIEMPKPWTTKPSLEFQGWSGTKAFMTARTALANETADALDESHLPSLVSATLPLRLDYYAGFDQQCAQNLPSRTLLESSAPPECVARNISVCWNGVLARRAPLGWYLSNSAAGGIDLSAMDAAVRLVKQMGAP